MKLQVNTIPTSSHWEILRTPPPAHRSTAPPASVIPDTGATSTVEDMSRLTGVQEPASSPPTFYRNLNRATSPETEGKPSPKFTSSFEIAENIMKSMGVKSPAMAAANISREKIRSALDGDLTSSHELLQTKSGAGAAPSVRDLTPPPASHRELSRTPAEAVHYESVQPESQPGRSRTPSRTKVPVHPLSFTNSSKLLKISFLRAAILHREDGWKW